MAEDTSDITNSTRKTRPSYRRNRDYGTHVTWTYELNKDLYTCYKHSEPRYTLRLKEIWDQLRPQYAYITAKHLSAQARRIVKKKLIPEETLRRQATSDAILTSNREDNMATNEKDTVDTIHSQDPHDQESMPSLITDVVNDTYSREQPEGLTETTSDQPMETCNAIEIDLELLENIKVKWTENYTKCRPMLLQEHEYTTKIDRNIPENEMRMVNLIVSEFIEENMKGKGISLWEINVARYTSAVTLLERLGRLKAKTNTYKNQKPGWQIQAETQINSLWKKLSLINVVEQCKANNSYTRHQRTIERKINKWYGSTKQETLQFRKVDLKQQLKTECEKLRRRKEVEERKRINYQFKTNPKQVYHKFKGEATVNITNSPTTEDIRDFWYNIWSVPRVFNSETQWLDVLREEHCKDIISKSYEVNAERFQSTLKKMTNCKAPGIDFIIVYWWKKLHSLHRPLVNLFANIFSNKLEIPQWLTLVRTILQPKNKDTHETKNYRPIACENTMFKLYTGILASFVNEHCNENNVITKEQAGGKKDSWGCAEQLLINKAATEE